MRLPLPDNAGYPGPPHPKPIRASRTVAGSRAVNETSNPQQSTRGARRCSQDLCAANTRRTTFSISTATNTTDASAMQVISSRAVRLPVPNTPCSGVQ